MDSRKVKAGRVLSVASECVPLVKTGGLADVVGALPAALATQGWDMRVLLPAYRSLRAGVTDWPVVWHEADLWGGPGRVLAGEVAGLSLLLLDAPHLYDREGGPYSGATGDHPDNAVRFAALSWVGARIAREGLEDWKPDILHAHDWQAGLAPAYLAYHGEAGQGAGGVKSVITVHNIAFQGWAPAQMLGILRLPGPLAIVVSRLTDQKGIDLLPAVIPDFVLGGGGLIVLGSGDPGLEGAMRALSARFPGRVAARIGYDEGLSHRLFAGADAVLVPSRFEPCGLTQMYGLRYGTVPVVALVGGLADTVIGASPATLAAKAATGVTFHPVDAMAFGRALGTLVELHAQPKLWARVRANAMGHPVGWETSAAAYAALYEGLTA